MMRNADLLRTTITLTPYVLELIALMYTMRGQTSSVPRYLGTLAQILRQGDEALDELQKFAKFVKTMATENREPTESEWEQLRIRVDATYQEIQDVQLDGGEVG